MYIPYMEAHGDNEELFDTVYFMYVVYKQKHEMSWLQFLSSSPPSLHAQTQP